MTFRSDIQILRGLAVLLVVLFHLGFQSVQSGFLGVDVFFVISGYLMAVLYDSQDTKGFFIRRAKRLLPAYYTVILLTLGVSFVINTPNETDQVVSQAFYGAAFLSNIGFWNQNSYFSKADFNPMLHLWSLGVEIQFYLIVPVLAWFFRKSRNFLYIFLLGSMAFCFLLITISPKTSFFMMPLRVWQFLFGYGAALYLSNSGSIKYSQYKWLGCLGLVLVISIPLLGVDGESQSVIDGHPGLIAFLVTVATAVVLVFGLPAKIESNFVSKGLVVLGNYSYSVYLVHFPIIVLFLSKPFGGTILTIANKQQFSILLVLIIVCSIALHKLVERRKFKLPIWKLSALSSAFIVVLALVLPMLKDTFITDDERKVFAAFQDRSAYRCGKTFRFFNPTASFCRLTKPGIDSGNNLMLLGNSHADSIKTAFTNVAESAGVNVYFAVANNPLMSGGLTAASVIEEALARNIGHIVVNYSPGGIAAEKLREFVSLADASDIAVTFIDPVPTWNEHIPRLMYRQLEGSKDDEIQSTADYLASNAAFFTEINKISNKNFRRISVVDYLCKPDCIYKTEDGVPLYFDPGHLTLTGSYLLKEAFVAALAQQAGPD